MEERRGSSNRYDLYLFCFRLDLRNYDFIYLSIYPLYLLLTVFDLDLSF